MTMKAVICNDFAPRSELRLAEVRLPEAGPGEVLVRVAACGINFFDGLMVEGKYQTRPDRPFTPGGEVAGTVEAMGPGVTSVAPGTRVLAFTGTGGYAEYAVAPAALVSPIPDSMDFRQAAGFLIAQATAHHGLKDRGRLSPGETLVVLGAAGGVGLAAVEIGRRMGARVIAGASDPSKLALCRAHGADETIDYVADDLRARIRDLTGGHGADVVLDPVGGALTEAALRSLATGGRLLVVGFASGEIPRVPANLLLLRQSAMIGVLWGAFARADPGRHAANMAELFGWFEEGSLRPHIGAEYPLDRYAEALDAVMERTARGKVVLTMPGS